jgi:SAM-dependent methyltransferase
LKNVSGISRNLTINRSHNQVILKILWQNFKKHYSGIKPETRDRQKEAEALIEKEEIISRLIKEHKGLTFLEVGLGPFPNVERMRLISQNNLTYTGCDFEDVCKTHEKLLDAKDLAEAKIRLISNRVGTYAWSLFDLMKMGEQFDLIYIDGNHTFYIDLPAFVIVDYLLKPGGRILIDDIDFTMISLLQDMASDFDTWNFYRLKYDFNQYETEQQRIPHIRKIVEDFLIPKLGYKMIELSENTFVELRLLKKL